MHVRTSIKKNKLKTYRYVQIVQSYRRDDGMPAHKVIASLGDLPQKTVENLKTALRASRQDKAVVIAPESEGVFDSKVTANLRYLDLAVMLEVWRRSGLHSLAEEILPAVEATAPGADVLAALTLQRCVEPGSKLKAQRWLPTTALPELLGLSTELFNNTRIHRFLEELDGTTAALQQRLSSLYEKLGADASAFFLDVTDTYFEGRGPELAERHRTKAGHRNKRTIGIVLLADQRGYPYRWHVVSSKTKDHTSMGEMIESVKNLSWAQGTPLVCDRAMGRDQSVRELLDSGLHFLTASPVNMIESYTKSLPHRSFTTLELEGSEHSRKRDLKLVREMAREIGLAEVDEDLFIVDLMKENRQGSTPLSPPGFQVAPSEDKEARRGRAISGKLRARSIAGKLELARQLRAKLDNGEYRFQRDLARDIGINETRLSEILRLLRLAPDIQERILDDKADVVLSWYRIREVVKEKDHQKQREMLADIMEPTSEKSGSSFHDKENSKSKLLTESRVGNLRIAAYFNPRMFVDQRQRSRDHLLELERFIEELNEDLAKAKKSRKYEPTLRKVTARLEKYGYSDAFDVTLNPIRVQTASGGEVDSFYCKLELKPKEWEKRRRYDGFVLLLCHSSLPHSDSELALLYRAKDAVEKDFKTIKSVVKLRPVYHHTDPKVRAHVTICMLSLLLHRMLEDRLRTNGIGLSGPACLEVLGTCHLNRMRYKGSPVELYSVTEASLAQRELLGALDFSNLVKDEAIREALKG